MAHGEYTGETLPAWSLPNDAVDRIALPSTWPERVTRDWAWGDSTGTRRSRLHPRLRRRGRPSARRRAREAVDDLRRRGRRGRSSRRTRRATSPGTEPPARASCARSPPTARSRACAFSGANFTGSGGVLLAGLRHAVEQGYDVINMSLSTTKKPFAAVLHELADSAYFRRTVLVASAHNMPVESYPWRFSSVISVGSHEDESPLAVLLQPEPAGGVLRAGRQRRRRVARRTKHPRVREQLRDAAPVRDLRAHPRQASGADAVSAEERAVSDLEQRRRWTVSERRDVRAAVAAGVLGSSESFRALLGAIVRSRVRSSARRHRRSSCSTRRPTSSCSRPSSERARSRCSACASRPATGSPDGCSRPERRSSSRT